MNWNMGNIGRKETGALVFSGCAVSSVKSPPDREDSGIAPDAAMQLPAESRIREQLVLVGLVKATDRIAKEMFGL